MKDPQDIHGPPKRQNGRGNSISTEVGHEVIAWHASGLSLRDIVAKLVAHGHPKVDPKTVAKYVRDNQLARRAAVESRRDDLAEKVLDSIAPHVVTDLEARAVVGARVEAYELEVAEIGRERWEDVLFETREEGGEQKRLERTTKEVDLYLKHQKVRIAAYTAAGALARARSAIVLDGLRAAGIVKEGGGEAATVRVQLNAPPESDAY